MAADPTLLMLSAVAADPLHGYGMIKSVEEMSGGRVRLRPGTLYAAIDRMVTDGLMELDREAVVDGRTRRYYAITQTGLAALEDRVNVLEGDVRAARRQLARRAKLTTGQIHDGPNSRRTLAELRTP
jgi:DNA-binding PadR family transcriptional regulator